MSSHNIRYDTVRYDATQNTTTQTHTIQYNTIQYNAMQYHTARHSNTTQRNTATHRVLAAALMMVLKVTTSGTIRASTPFLYLVFVFSLLFLCIYLVIHFNYCYHAFLFMLFSCSFRRPSCTCAGRSESTAPRHPKPPNLKTLEHYKKSFNAIYFD